MRWAYRISQNGNIWNEKWRQSKYLQFSSRNPCQRVYCAASKCIKTRQATTVHAKGDKMSILVDKMIKWNMAYSMGLFGNSNYLRINLYKTSRICQKICIVTRWAHMCMVEKFAHYPTVMTEFQNLNTRRNWPEKYQSCEEQVKRKFGSGDQCSLFNEIFLHGLFRFCLER